MVKARANIAVKFQGVSIGENTARVGVKIDRDDLPILEAEELLCGRRLTGVIKTTQIAGEGEGQKALAGMEDAQLQIKGVFDIKALSVTAKHISCGLTFALKEIEGNDLMHLSKRPGRLLVNQVATLDSDDEEDEQGGDDE